MEKEPKREGKYLIKQGVGKVYDNEYGIYCVQTSETIDPGYFSVGTSYCLPKKAHENHSHPVDDEIIYFINGTGIQTVGDEAYAVQEGDMVYLPAGVPHSIECTCKQPLRMIIIKVNTKNKDK